MFRYGLLLSAAAVLAGLASTAASAQDIVIGFTGPVTGPAAFLGQHMKWGAELAVKTLEKSGGVLGRKVVFQMQDSQCRPADAIAGAENLLAQDKADLLLGDVCSGATLALMPIAERAQKPMIVSISTLPEITAKAGAGGNPWVFRTVPTDSMMAAVAAQKLKAANVKTIAFLAEDTDYGRASITLLKSLLGTGTAVVSEDYVKTTETDFLSTLTKLRSAKPDAIGLFMLDQQGGNFMKQYAQFGLTMPLVGRPPLMATAAKELIVAGKLDGSWTVYPYFDQASSPANAAFVAAFNEHAKQAPHYVAYGVYESILVAAAAIKSAGKTDAAAVRDALARTNYEGMLGPIAFDANNQAHNNMLHLVVENGKLVVKELLAAR